MGLVFGARRLFQEQCHGGDDLNVEETLFLHKDWQKMIVQHVTSSTFSAIQEEETESFNQLVSHLSPRPRWALKLPETWGFLGVLSALLSSWWFSQKSVQKGSQEIWHLIGFRCRMMVWHWCVAVARLHSMIPSIWQHTSKLNHLLFSCWFMSQRHLARFLVTFSAYSIWTMILDACKNWERLPSIHPSLHFLCLLCSVQGREGLEISPAATGWETCMTNNHTGPHCSQTVSMFLSVRESQSSWCEPTYAQWEHENGGDFLSCWNVNLPSTFYSKSFQVLPA